MSETRAKTIGGFAIDGEIGSGGMGVVLLGRQESLDRPAVLKKIRRDVSAIPEFASRFEREARAQANVHHENVVAVYDCFRWRGDQYIAQEYVDGVDLHRILRHVGALPPRIAALIGLAVARGLEAIHTRGTIHRDLKPANILLSRTGEVKIADFGIALDPSEPALTQPGIAIGTPPYMPPEQLQGDRVDGRGDLYSFGVVLYEMLAGETPFPEPGEGEEAETLLARMLREKYDRVRKKAGRVPRYLARVVRTCLRPRPRSRFASSTDLRRALERHAPRVSAADARAEIAAWLWRREVLEPDADSTVFQAAPSPPRERRARGALAWASIGAASVVLATSTLWVRAYPEDALALRDTAIEKWEAALSHGNSPGDAHVTALDLEPSEAAPEAEVPSTKR